MNPTELADVTITIEDAAPGERGVNRFDAKDLPIRYLKLQTADGRVFAVPSDGSIEAVIAEIREERGLRR